MAGKDTTLEARIEELEANLEEQAEIIEEQRDRIEELESGDDGTADEESPSVSRRGALQAGGVLALLGIGANTASADPQGRLGTASDPIQTVWTAEMNGPISDSQLVRKLNGFGLFVDGNDELAVDTDDTGWQTDTVEGNTTVQPIQSDTVDMSTTDQIDVGSTDVIDGTTQVYDSVNQQISPDVVTADSLGSLSSITVDAIQGGVLQADKLNSIDAGNLTVDTDGILQAPKSSLWTESSTSSITPLEGYDTIEVNSINSDTYEQVVMGSTLELAGNNLNDLNSETRIYDAKQGAVPASAIETDGIGTAELDLSMTPIWSSPHTWSTGGVADLTLDDSGISYSSGENVTFNIQNSGTGGVDIQEDGTSVVTESITLTGGSGIQSIGDLSANRTVALADNGVTSTQITRDAVTSTELASQSYIDWDDGSRQTTGGPVAKGTIDTGDGIASPDNTAGVSSVDMIDQFRVRVSISFSFSDPSEIIAFAQGRSHHNSLRCQPDSESNSIVIESDSGFDAPETFQFVAQSLPPVQ